MDEFDIPIFKKVYDLYKTVHHIRTSVPKQDRHTLWQKCEDTSLSLIERILQATSLPRAEKVPILNRNEKSLRQIFPCGKNLHGGSRVQEGQALKESRLRTSGPRTHRESRSCCHPPSRRRRDRTGRSCRHRHGYRPNRRNWCGRRRSRTGVRQWRGSGR